MSDFAQTLVTALSIGCMYALIALGYTMVYGVLKFINFAHGDVFTVGAWGSLTIATGLGFVATGRSPWAVLIVLPAVMIGCGVLAFVIERFAYRPLRDAPRLNVLITAIGVSLLIQNVGQLPFVFGKNPRSMPDLITPLLPASAAGGINLGIATILPVDLIAILSAVTLMIGMEVLIFHTKLGRAMRAVSFNHRTAALMGINVDRVIGVTFVLGAVLAGVAGFLYATKYSTLNQPAFTTWVLLGLTAFVAAVVGGIGNVRGAFAGGILIGIIEQFGMRFRPDLKEVYVFATLILVLLVRPSGLFGSAVTEKV